MKTVASGVRVTEACVEAMRVRVRVRGRVRVRVRVAMPAWRP